MDGGSSHGRGRHSMRGGGSTGRGQWFKEYTNSEYVGDPDVDADSQKERHSTLR